MGAVIDEDALNIYTDGSSYSGPRRGGIGILFVWVDENGDPAEEEIPFPGYQEGSNNEMELLAVVKALEEAFRRPELLEKVQRIIVYSDSQYVVGNIDSAKFAWPKQQWKTRDGNPIANVLLWKKLVRLFKRPPKRVYFKWVPGHSGNEYNREADKTAKGSAKKVPLNKPLRVVDKRRKTTEKITEVGSVKMRGQRISIRIVTAEKVHGGLHKYRYEVVSPRSRFYGNADLIWSELYLAAGHHYEVTLNKDSAKPRILLVLRELDRKAS